MISGVVFVDIHTATEMAYKNGYLKGFTQVREETFWVEKDNIFVCGKCKSKNKEMTRYCPNCGRVVFKLL